MPNSMSDSQVLERAVEILDEHGWCQRTAMMPDGKVCAGQALHMALHGDEWAHYDWGVGDLGRFKGLAEIIVSNSDMAVMQKVAFTLPWILDSGPSEMEVIKDLLPAIHIWNDSQVASVEDVKLAFKKSIEQLQAEGR